MNQLNRPVTQAEMKRALDAEYQIDREFIEIRNRVLSGAPLEPGPYRAEVVDEDRDQAHPWGGSQKYGLLISVSGDNAKAEPPVKPATPEEMRDLMRDLRRMKIVLDNQLGWLERELATAGDTA